MSRVAITVWMMAMVGMAAGRLSAQDQAPALSVDVLEARAVERHPAVLEALAQVAAARGRAAQAGAWDNPTVGATASELRPRESPSGSFGGFVEQTFALGGKRQADRAVASSEVVVRMAELEAARMRVRLAVRVAYYEMAAAAERLKVAERLAAVAGESVLLARQLANVGMADRPDVLEAEAEAARQSAALVATRARQIGAWRRLAAASADLTLATQPVMVLTGEAIPSLDREASLAQILATSPVLKAAEAEVERDRLAVDVERRRTSPDLALRAGANWNRERLSSPGTSRPLGWEFGVDAGITLPLFDVNRNGVLAAGSSVNASEARAARVRLEIEAHFATVFEEYEAARVMAEAYRSEVLPKVEEAYGLYLARYREMAAPYPRVLVAQRTLVMTTEDYGEAVSRAWQAAARVQGLVLDDWRR